VKFPGNLTQPGYGISDVLNQMGGRNPIVGFGDFAISISHILAELNHPLPPWTPMMQLLAIRFAHSNPWATTVFVDELYASLLEGGLYGAGRSKMCSKGSWL
jgi:hypothetical protein